MERLVLHSGCMGASTAIDSLTERVIGCAIEVHRILGPGLLEAVYLECLTIEMRIGGLGFEPECRVPLEYRGHRLNRDLKVDLVVDGRLVVEVKAVEQLHPVHLAQTITYLKLTGCEAGLLMNFNSTTLKGGLRRLTHPDLYVKKTTGSQEAT